MARSLVLGLALFVAGCAWTGSLTGNPRPAPPSAPPATATARGAEILVQSAGRTHYFENRLPHCLAYALEGDWEFADQQAALRTADRRRFVGVVLQSAEALPGPAGGDLATRAIAQIIADTEKEWGTSVRASVEPFAASRAGGVLLRFEDVLLGPQAVAQASRAGGVTKSVRLPLRVVATFDTRLVMIVTSLEGDDAREIFRTLEVTEDPQCWRRTIRERFPGVLK